MLDILINTANWHADKALHAYMLKDIDLYARHIHICDNLRRRVWMLQHA